MSLSVPRSRAVPWGASRRLVAAERAIRTSALTLGGLALVCAIAVAPVAQPTLYRALFAVALALNLLVLAVLSPRSAALVTLALLPFLALARRLLIPVTHWQSADPLLLVAPAVVCFLGLRLFVMERRRLVADRLSMLVAALLGLILIQSFNPTGPGLLANLGGVLFMAMPLLWFFIGRELADARAVRGLTAWVIAVGLMVAMYSYWQTHIGFPSWDTDWIKQGGYSALYVTHSVVRAFGTFSSSQEDAAFLGIALIVMLAIGLHRRPGLLLLLPIPVVALFLESSRGIFLVTSAVFLVTIAFAVFVVPLRTRNGAFTTALAILTFATPVAGLTLAKGSLNRSAQSGNALVAHQIAGILQPTNSQSSTLRTHVSEIKAGLREWAHHPWGDGAGSTTIAGTQLSKGYQSRTTENDFTNSLIALGPLGPILLISITVIALSRAFRRYLRGGGAEVLAAAGVMLVTLGTWLNGGEYAIAPLTWFLIGWVAGRPFVANRRQPTHSGVPQARPSSAGR